ncbi:MAG TPA: hypothetical protein DDZ51_17525 [Planctomycetaceae bacterium]|nr:hypothetical protein [Planctomycetaceae bacterium]
MNRNDEVLVRVDGISKKFCRSLKKSLWYGVKDIAHELNPFSKFSAVNGQLPVDDLSATLREDEFWAVNDVSFELRRGECLGLIGHNGAGKTTLLKMLNGLIKPDRGHIEMRGRVGALIALGAGFNPILTGRENVYVNAAILGLTKKEIDEKLEEIIDFAEIGEFIDAPVQSYSSGMQVRLGFAVATTLKPDILLLDEVLAVGDRTFRDKCYHRVGTLLSSAAVVFVSHDESSMRRISETAILLNRGRKIAYGNTDDIFKQYNAQPSVARSETKFVRDAEIINSLDAKLVSVACENQLGVNVSSIVIDLMLHIGQTIDTHCLLALGNISRDGGVIAVQFDFTSVFSELRLGLNRIRFSVENVSVRRGDYTVSLVVFDHEGKLILFSVRDFGRFVEESNVAYGPLVVAPVAKRG